MAFALSTIFWHIFPNKMSLKSMKIICANMRFFGDKNVGEIDPCGGRDWLPFFLIMDKELI
jgi:hypothetical protein